MQDLTKSLILLNGELKTLQIASISKLGANAFRVSFKNNPKSYTYSADKVVWLTNPQWLVPELCKVYRGGRLQTDVTEIGSLKLDRIIIGESNTAADMRENTLMGRLT